SFTLTVEIYELVNDKTKLSTLIALIVEPRSKFEVDENDCLYIQPVVKDGVVSEKCRMIPKYDVEMQTLILLCFYDQANHCEYHKTFFAISEKHIGIIQEEVKAYVNQYISETTISETAPEPTYVPGTIATSETAPEPTYASETTTTSETAPESTNTSEITAASETASELSKTSEITVTTKTASELSNAYGTTALNVMIASETTTLDTMTSEAAMEKCILQMLETHQSINALLEKYHKKLCRQSVHKKKTVNNTIEPRTEITIAPDYNINQQTHKRKLQLTFSEQGVFKSLKSNNHITVVEVNGKDIQ
ncbi:14801_t:CDS:2, partial [Cetraspora pellucida]